MAKIAVASTDGKVVNQHFGRADTFYILETDENNGFTCIEIRKSPPVCEGGEHDDNNMKKRVQSLADCEYVLVSRIGIRAENELNNAGIDVYEIPGYIEESVDKLMKYLVIQNMFK